MPHAETAAPPPPPERGLVHRVAQGLALLGGLLMAGVAGLVAFSVAKRWATNQGVNGDFEMVQIALALSVFAFLPLCQLRRGNVMVDTFTLRLPGAAQRGLDALWDLVFGAFAAFIAWRLWLGAADQIGSRTTSMVLALPTGYAIAACSAMAGFLALVCGLTALRRLRDRP
jgi:TRAP-type C4-dicarboxylate transport system permease small subunit